MSAAAAPSFLEELLSVCVCVAARSGDVVRAVQRSRDEGSALAAELKDAADPRTYLTVADQRAQKAIVHSLRAAFPGLRIVGEEDEAEVDAAVAEWAATPAGAAALSSEGLRRDAVRDLFGAAADAADVEDYAWVTLDDVVVFVDPIDGTREFVQGRVDACLTLIGVSVRGRATAGVMYLPFHQDGRIGEVPTPPSDASGHCIYGVRGVGVRGLEGCAAAAQAAGVRLATSASCSDPTLAKVREVVAAAETLSAGGCANKILRVLTGHADAALLNLANSLWDTCATEAVLAAAGGALTTLHGNPIEHTPHGETGNRFGALATGASYAAAAGRTHAELCRTLRDVPEVNELFTKHLGTVSGEVQAADVIRDVTGVYYTADALSRMFCDGEAGHVAGYSCPEADAVRYKQSYACRINLVRSASADARVPESVFYKRVVLRDMPYAVKKARAHPFKLARDIKSCLVEAEFLSSACPALFAATSGCSVARPYSVQREVFAAHAIDSRFGCILRDISHADGWTQHAHLSTQQIDATMRCLAHFHAFFWQGARAPGAAPKADEAAAVAAVLPHVWPAGTYWDAASQPADQIENLEARWQRFTEKFHAHLPAEVGSDKTVGLRLAAVGADVNARTHGVDFDGQALAHPHEEFQRFRTVIHGDAKPGNFFFRPQQGGCSNLDVGVIDFQWTGGGLGVTDVAYCLAAGTHPDSVSIGDAQDLHHVRVYHHWLMKAFVTYGVASTPAEAEALYPYDLVQKHYERSLLDLARTVIGDHWNSVDPAILDSRHMAMAFNAYNKSTKVTCWLAHRIKTYMDNYGK